MRELTKNEIDVVSGGGTIGNVSLIVAAAIKALGGCNSNTPRRSTSGGSTLSLAAAAIAAAARKL